MKKSDEPVVVEQTFDAPIETVWKAITKADRMRQWYFEPIETFEPTVGFQTRFNVVSEGRNFVHLWKVTDVEPPKTITYNWKYEDYAGDSFVTFELSGQDNTTTLRLSHRVVEDFADGIPEFSRSACIAGWSYFIQEALKKYLEKA